MPTEIVRYHQCSWQPRGNLHQRYLARGMAVIFCLASVNLLFADNPSLDTPEPSDFCQSLPRPENAALEQVPVGSGWFQVYRATDGVYAFVEAYQFQETISYLILGSEKALLFDSGLGLVPLRPVVEALTNLPVEVLNSHTHFDHVGGNAEFDTVLAFDTPYTRANMAGFPHDELISEVAPEAFCQGPPEGADLDGFHTRSWRATRYVHDGEVIDLGGRSLEVLYVPGHTPDSLVLLDRSNGLMWTGDTYYNGGLWLFVPETSLDDYQASIARLVKAAATVKLLLPAHNTANAAPEQLVKVSEALVKLRSGTLKGTPESGGRLVFEVDGITLLTAQQVLDGTVVDTSGGGSGLTSWP